MRMTKSLVIATVVAALFVGTRAFGQTKIAVVDLQLAIASTEEGKRAKAKLEKLLKEKQKELDEKTEKIKKMEKEMQSQLPLLSEEGRQKLMENYRKQLMELQKLYMDNQTFLAKKKAELLKPILDKMSKVVAEIAQKEGYSIVLDSSAGIVLYVEPANDLTSEVIRRYNQKK